MPSVDYSIYTPSRTQYSLRLTGLQGPVLRWRSTFGGLLQLQILKHEATRGFARNRGPFRGPCPNTESRPGRCSKLGPVDSSASPAVAHAEGVSLLNRTEVG